MKKTILFVLIAIGLGTLNPIVFSQEQSTFPFESEPPFALQHLKFISSKIKQAAINHSMEKSNIEYFPIAFVTGSDYSESHEDYESLDSIALFLHHTINQKTLEFALLPELKGTNSNYENFTDNTPIVLDDNIFACSFDSIQFFTYLPEISDYYHVGSYFFTLNDHYTPIEIQLQVIGYYDEKYTLEYNEDNLLTKISSSYYQPEQWIEHSYEAFDYDNHHNLISDVIYSLDDVGNYIPTSRKTYTYNPNNQVTSYLYETFNGYGLENTLLFEYQYTDALLSETAKYYWDVYEGNWTPNENHVLSYNANNNLESVIFQEPSSWDPIEWYDIQKIDYSFNSDHQCVTEEQFWYDGTWTPWREKEYNYTNGKLVEEIEYIWNMMGVKENNKRSTATFYPFGKIDITYDYSWLEDEWGIGYDDEYNKYYYLEIDLDEILTVPEEKQARIQVYPNPADQFIQIVSPSNYELSSIILYDLQGKTVYKSNVTNSFKHIIPTHQFQEGLYYIEIKGENLIEKTPIIIQHR